MNNLTKEQILGVNINISKYEEVLEKISEYIKNNDSQYIVTPNPEIVILAQKDKAFRGIINKATISIPDGKGIVWASRLKGGQIKETITGTDLMLKLCEEGNKRGWSIFLLGGKEDVSIKLKNILHKKFPNLKIVGSIKGYPDAAYDNQVLAEITETTDNHKIDFLFVAYGAPKQEEWISRNLSKLPVNIAIGVGGAFDYLSGEVKRAPKWIRELGFEWLFRLVNEPWRWKRQLRLVKFIYLILFREK